MEGKFASDGLQAIDDGDDTLMAMARELVTEKGIGDCAHAVWKQLVEKRAEVFGVREVRASPPPVEVEAAETGLETITIPEVDAVGSYAATDVRKFARDSANAQGCAPSTYYRGRIKPIEAVLTDSKRGRHGL
jgi:hypothetical protein